MLCFVLLNLQTFFLYCTITDATLVEFSKEIIKLSTLSFLKLVLYVTTRSNKYKIKMLPYSRTLKVKKKVSKSILTHAIYICKLG